MLCHLLAAVAMLLGQPASDAERQPESKLGPEQSLAIRLEQQRTVSRALPEVVIVSDAPSFLEAIGKWKATVRFPVLWDDGSVRAKEDIARFVHAYQPKRVLRFEAEGAEPWPRERPERIERIEHGLFSSFFGASDPGSMKAFAQQLRAGHWPLVGLVLADPDDEAWPGALALAAGHGEPIGFTSIRGGLNAVLSREQAGEVEKFARELAEALELSWRAPSDDVDALTIGIACPAKVEYGAQPRDFRATTDVLGRIDPDGVARWAWCGQLAGDEARSTYVAMCSLFLSAGERAWVFDGYSSKPGWNQYDGTKAGAKLQERKWETTVFDAPRQGLQDWRAACARSIDAGLILVNSMGNADFFRLEPGDAAPGDVPLLTRPAAVYFVHSFSLMFPGRTDTVGGRWLEHGAYVYLGSVQEPTLAAFVPTPAVAERLAAGFPFGVSVRQPTQAWKLATFGDPLATLHAAPQRTDEALPLEHTSDLASAARDATASGSFGEAISLFAMIGDDDSAVRLAGGILRDRPEAFDRDVARGALMPMFRANRPDEVIACFRRLSPEDQQNDLFLDALWDAARLRAGTNEAVLTLLRQHLRPGQVVEDATELAELWAQRYGSSSAVGMLQAVRATIEKKRDQQKMDREIQRRLRGG